MTQNWAAVARAINQRMTELGLIQQQLIDRSQVSRQVVGEIQRNTVQRQRGAPILVALSVALEWHPHHLSAVLDGRRTPDVGHPVVTFVSPGYDVPGRLASIEGLLRAMNDRLAHIEEQVSRRKCDG